MEVVEDAGYIEDFVNVAGDTDTGEAEHNEDPGNNHLRSQHRLDPHLSPCSSGICRCCPSRPRLSGMTQD